MRKRFNLWFLLTVTLTIIALLGGIVTSNSALAEESDYYVDTNQQPLTVRTGPGTNFPPTGRTIPDGTAVDITCQVAGSMVNGKLGTSRLWDRLSTGGYVSDAYVYTGSDGRVAPECGTTGDQNEPTGTVNTKPPAPDEPEQSTPAPPTPAACNPYGPQNADLYLTGNTCPPAGFPYSPDIKFTVAGRRAIDPYNDGCSGPTRDHTYSFDRRDACAMHDYGYDLLRAGAPGITRDEVDSHLRDDMDVDCHPRHSMFWVDVRPLCPVSSAIWDDMVKRFGRADYGDPIDGPGGVKYHRDLNGAWTTTYPLLPTPRPGPSPRPPGR